MSSLFRLEQQQKKKNPFRIRLFSLFLSHLELKQEIRSYTPVVPLKTIPDSIPKWSKSIPVFRPKRRKNHTFWGGTYLAYIGEYAPQPRAKKLCNSGRFVPQETEGQIFYHRIYLCVQYFFQAKSKILNFIPAMHLSTLNHVKMWHYSVIFYV